MHNRQLITWSFYLFFYASIQWNKIRKRICKQKKNTRSEKSERQTSDEFLLNFLTSLNTLSSGEATAAAAWMGKTVCLEVQHETDFASCGKKKVRKSTRLLSHFRKIASKEKKFFLFLSFPCFPFGFREKTLKLPMRVNI